MKDAVVEQADQFHLHSASIENIAELVMQNVGHRVRVSDRRDSAVVRVFLEKEPRIFHLGSRLGEGKTVQLQKLVARAEDARRARLIKILPYVVDWVLPKIGTVLSGVPLAMFHEPIFWMTTRRNDPFEVAT